MSFPSSSHIACALCRSFKVAFARQMARAFFRALQIDFSWPWAKLWIQTLSLLSYYRALKSARQKCKLRL